MADRRRHEARQRGMTLVEVLVALAILAMVSVSVLSLVSQNARFMAGAEDRLLAQILADNLMTERLAQSAPLERGETETALSFAERDWAVTENVIEPGVQGLVRIEIAIRRQDAAQTLSSAATLKQE